MSQQSFSFMYQNNWSNNTRKNDLYSKHWENISQASTKTTVTF